MNTTDIKNIKLSETRQRQEFDADKMQELIDSIIERGLLHAIVCREEGGEIILVAGERRLRAIKTIWQLGGPLLYNNQLLKENHIPYVTMGELSELEAEEAEFDENFRRTDLTWQEQSLAHKKLHNLRTRQMEANALPPNESGTRPDPTGDSWSYADTAQEVFGRRDGGYQSTIRKEAIIADHLSDPDIASAKSLQEGFKILKKKEELQKTASLAAAIGVTFSARDHSVFHANCLDWMQNYSGPGFDVICTDPPYGMNAQNFGDGGGKYSGITHNYDDSLEKWLLLMETWCPLSIKITKREAHAYIFCDFDRFHQLKAFMQKAGWDVFRTPIICRKLNSGRVPRPEHGPRRTWEMCLYAIKGNKRTIRIYPDWAEALPDKNDGHGATKPVSLYTNLLQRSIQPGDHVIDTFAGSGPIFGAAQLLKCYATGVEMEQEYYGLSLKRLQALEEEE